MIDWESSPVAVITGCGRRRVGFFIAKHLLASGYRIAAVYRSDEGAAKKLCDQLFHETASEMAGEMAGDPSQIVRPFYCNVSGQDSVEKLRDAVVERFGRVDAMISTASVWKPIKLEDVTQADLMAAINVDLIGTFHCNRVFGLQMAGQKSGGCLINFGDWADCRPYLDHAAYFAAKGSIPTLTRTMARELAERNPKVRVHCILPGPVLLPPGADQVRREALLDSTLVKQVDRPDSVAMAVEHFLRNDFLNGIVLPVDGGRTIFSPGESD